MNAGTEPRVLAMVRCSGSIFKNNCKITGSALLSVASQLLTNADPSKAAQGWFFGVAIKKCRSIDIRALFSVNAAALWVGTKQRTPVLMQR
jgi:hypothetical protein